MSIAIVQHTPAWVWSVFAPLLAFGLSQTRPRRMGLLRVTILPLMMIALSLSGVFRAFGHAPLALAGRAAGVGVALTFARGLVEACGARWLAATGTLHLPGSWLPLALIVGLAAVEYVAGASLGVQPSLATDPGFAGLCSLGYGSFGGLFLARGWGLRRRAKRSPAPRVA